jgi:hypothetical protein
MRRSWACLAIAAVVTLTSSVRAQQQAQFMLVMTDDKGDPVPGFKPSDLEVFEDGKPVKVVKVEPKTSALKVVLALDNGRPLTDISAQVRQAAKDFLKTLPANVEVALMTTAPVPRFVAKSTLNRDAVLKAVDVIAPDSAPGRTVEAIQDVAREWRKAQGDLVLVIFGSTFVAEPVNKADLDEAKALLKTERAVVHAVILAPSSNSEGDAQRGVAQVIASTTGGRFEAIGSHLQLNVLSEIAKSLGVVATGGQFIVTVERQPGATGRLGALSLSPADGFQAGKITRMQ